MPDGQRLCHYDGGPVFEALLSGCAPWSSGNSAPVRPLQRTTVRLHRLQMTSPLTGYDVIADHFRFPVALGASFTEQQ